MRNYLGDFAIEIHYKGCEIVPKHARKSIRKLRKLTERDLFTEFNVRSYLFLLVLIFCASFHYKKILLREKAADAPPAPYPVRGLSSLGGGTLSWSWQGGWGIGWGWGWG